MAGKNKTELQNLQHKHKLKFVFVLWSLCLCCRVCVCIEESCVSNADFVILF